MADLRLDTGLLRSTGAELRFLAEELNSAAAHIADEGAALGHPGVLAALQQFADDWDHRRLKMTEDIVQLAEQATGTGEVFDQLERDFVAALRGESA